MKRKLTTAIVAISIACLLPLACKKGSQTNDSPNNDMLKSILLNWMGSQKINLGSNKEFTDTLILKARWADIEVKTIGASEQMVYVPVTVHEKNVGLLFLMRSGIMKVEQGFVLDVASQNGEAAVSALMQQFYQYKSTGFSGLLKAYDFGNHFKWQLTFSKGRYISRTSIMNSGRIDVNRLPGSGRVTRVAPPGGAGNACQSWYLVTYYDDGSSDWDYIGTTCDNCEMTRHMESSAGNFETNCGGGGGGGDGNTNVYLYDTVHNNLTNPCFGGVLNTMLSSGLNSELVTIFRNTFNTTDEVDFNMGEVSALGDGADAVTNASKSGNYVTVTSQLNEQALANASKEYIAETMFHEILHGYFDVNTNLVSELNQHIEMVTSYVDCELAALQEMFPALNSHDGLCLILGGMGNVQALSPTTLSNAMSHYQLTQNDVVSTNNTFKTGNTGHRCNPNTPLE